MSTKHLIAVAAVIVLAIAAYFAFTYKAAAPVDQEAATSTPETNEDSAGATASPAIAATVTYTDAGFSPSTVTIKAGETVRFTNNSAGGMWVGSDDHPTHTEYDGSSTREHCANGTATTDTFDQCTASASGTSYDYTFTKTGTWGYHNHVGSSKTGTVVVTD